MIVSIVAIKKLTGKFVTKLKYRPNQVPIKEKTNVKMVIDQILCTK